MRLLAPLAAIALLFANFAALAEDAADRKFAVGVDEKNPKGRVEFTAPEGWKKVKPKSFIVEVEFEVPAAKGDETPGRLTAMGAGGDIQANIDRWVGQFQGDVKPQIDKLTVDGAEVQVVSLAGTYKDSPAGPFAGGKTTLRENYQMLGAICKTEKGNYFLKLYGHKSTIGDNEKAFRSLV
jgi:hypothetical protein